jgi:hypothetical protein
LGYYRETVSRLNSFNGVAKTAKEWLETPTAFATLQLDWDRKGEISFGVFCETAQRYGKRSDFSLSPEDLGQTPREWITTLKKMGRKRIVRRFSPSHVKDDL